MKNKLTKRLLLLSFVLLLATLSGCSENYQISYTNKCDGKLCLSSDIKNALEDDPKLTKELEDFINKNNELVNSKTISDKISDGTLNDLDDLNDEIKDTLNEGKKICDRLSDKFSQNSTYRSIVNKQCGMYEEFLSGFLSYSNEMNKKYCETPLLQNSVYIDYISGLYLSGTLSYREYIKLNDQYINDVISKESTQLKYNGEDSSDFQKMSVIQIAKKCFQKNEESFFSDYLENSLYFGKRQNPNSLIYTKYPKYHELISNYRKRFFDNENVKKEIARYEYNKGDNLLKKYSSDILNGVQEMVDNLIYKDIHNISDKFIQIKNVFSESTIIKGKRFFLYFSSPNKDLEEFSYIFLRINGNNTLAPINLKSNNAYLYQIEEGSGVFLYELGLKEGSGDNLLNLNGIKDGSYVSISLSNIGNSSDDLKNYFDVNSISFLVNDDKSNSILKISSESSYSLEVPTNGVLKLNAGMGFQNEIEIDLGKGDELGLEFEKSKGGEFGLGVGSERTGLKLEIVGKILTYVIRKYKYELSNFSKIGSDEDLFNKILFINTITEDLGLPFISKSDIDILNKRLERSWRDIFDGNKYDSHIKNEKIDLITMGKFILQSVKDFDPCKTTIGSNFALLNKWGCGIGGKIEGEVGVNADLKGFLNIGFDVNADGKVFNKYFNQKDQNYNISINREFSYGLGLDFGLTGAGGQYISDYLGNSIIKGTIIYLIKNSSGFDLSQIDSYIKKINYFLANPHSTSKNKYSREINIALEGPNKQNDYYSFFDNRVDDLNVSKIEDTFVKNPFIDGSDLFEANGSFGLKLKITRNYNNIKFSDLNLNKLNSFLFANDESNKLKLSDNKNNYSKFVERYKELSIGQIDSFVYNYMDSQCNIGDNFSIEFIYIKNSRFLNEQSNYEGKTSSINPFDKEWIKNFEPLSKNLSALKACNAIKFESGKYILNSDFQTGMIDTGLIRFKTVNKKENRYTVRNDVCGLKGIDINNTISEYNKAMDSLYDKLNKIIIPANKILNKGKYIKNDETLFSNEIPIAKYKCKNGFLLKEYQDDSIENQDVSGKVDILKGDLENIYKSIGGYYQSNGNNLVKGF